MANTPEETPEQKLDRLITENASLKEANVSLSQANEKLKDESDVLRTENDTLTSAQADLREQYESLQVEFTEEITVLSAQLAKAKVVSDEFKPTITVDNVDYLVLGKKFIYQHKEYTLQHLLHDEAMQRALVNKGVGFLVKLEPAAENTIV